MWVGRSITRWSSPLPSATPSDHWQAALLAPVRGRRGEPETKRNPTHLLQILLNGNYSSHVKTVPVLHAGDGYLYLIRQVAAHDARLAAGASLAAYYTVTGQPPGRWVGTGASRIGAAGVVTEAQMKSLFGDGLHPDADRIQSHLHDEGLSAAEAVQASCLGRRFPRYRPAAKITDVARESYRVREQRLGRPLTAEEKLASRQEAVDAVFRRRTGRAAVDPVELGELGKSVPASSRREAVAGYDLAFTSVKSVSTLMNCRGCCTAGAGARRLLDGIGRLRASRARRGDELVRVPRDNPS